MSAAPEISLPRFAGPLDLLLALVRSHEVEVTEIPVAEITRQYLDYLHKAEELNLDLGADFVYMAAWLIQIKSRCLLPRDPEIAAREPDPQQELVGQLLDHAQVRQAAAFLQEKLGLAEASWSKSSLEEFRDPPAADFAEPDGALNLLQILRLAQQALAAARTYDLLTPADPVTVGEMMSWLEKRLAAAPVCVDGGAMLAEQPNAAHRAALFLAMLEMARDGQIRLEQERCFGPLALIRT